MTTIAIKGLSAPVLANRNDADFLVEASAAVVAEQPATAIGLFGSGHDLEVRGLLLGGVGVELGDLSLDDLANRLVVRDGGLIAGATSAVRVQGSASILNEGQIRGGERGIHVLNVTGPGVDIVNTGLIAGGRSGLDLATGPGLQTIRNEGTIRGHIFSIEGGPARIDIVNRGVLDGDVRLSWQDDRVDNRGGTILGEIRGGEGDDRFLPGLGAETFLGQTGIDVLDFRSGAGIVVSLADPSQNTGRAAGDSYSGIDRILGSAKGDDVLTGGDGWETLRGGGGNDVLSGGGGFDWLVGGTGANTLTGGDGNDVFVFLRPGQGRDVVTDFLTLGILDDKIAVGAKGFGGGLVAGHALTSDQLVMRASDNAAQDAEDRFVFRDSDDTLWFDADGSGAAAALLVCDLEGGSPVTFRDILLV